MLPQFKTNGLDNFKTDQNFQNKTNSSKNDLSNEGYEISRYQTNSDKLNALQSLFSEKSGYFKPNTTSLRTLKKRIDILKKSLNRPQEVLVNYRELSRDARRNEQLLANIESQKIALELDLARKQDPWELISDPTVTANPILPSRNKSIFYSFLIGLGISSLYVLVDYKNKDIIDEFSGFNEIIPFKFLKTFSEDNLEQWSDSFKLFKKNYLINENKTGLLFISREESANKEKFERILRSNTKEDNVIISSIPFDFESCKDLIIFIQKASINRKDLNYLLEDINLIEVNTLGWVLID